MEDAWCDMSMRSTSVRFRKKKIENSGEIDNKTKLRLVETLYIPKVSFFTDRH
jgi:hypothetical protein